jgi:sec-independent protein translocase protein TatA
LARGRAPAYIRRNEAPPGGACDGFVEVWAMGSLSIWHWVILLAVVALLFGGRGKLSGLMGDAAKGIRAFRDGLKGDDDTSSDSKSSASLPRESEKEREREREREDVKR